MKKVMIRTVIDEFYFEAFKYKICGSYNSKIEACRVGTTNVKKLFTYSDIVEVDDEEAKKIYIYISNIVNSINIDLTELKRGLKMLEDQGITSQ